MTVLFAGGGTGGHLYPAIAIADALRALLPETRVVFTGNRERIEGRVIPSLGYEFVASPVRGLPRTFTLANVSVAVRLMAALAQSFYTLRTLRPAVVVGTGGYVSGPPVFMASVLGIPTLIQEQNSEPGITTWFLTRRATEVHVAFDTTLRLLPRTDHVYLSGNPVRMAIGGITRAEGAGRYGFDPSKTTLLVTGGSLGAESINDALLGAIPQLVAEGVQLLWLTGDTDYRRMLAAVEALAIPHDAMVRLAPFEEQMEYAFATCDLAVCRAGATTLAELALTGIPSVLVPYPHAAADHQRVNAQSMVQEGAAVMIMDKDAREQLGETVRALLLDPQRRATMAGRVRALARPDAARTIATAIVRLGQHAHG